MWHSDSTPFDAVVLCSINQVCKGRCLKCLKISTVDSFEYVQNKALHEAQ